MAIGYKTRLPGGATDTRDPRNPNQYKGSSAADTPWYWKPRVGSGYGFAPRYEAPRWSGAWDAFDSAYIPVPNSPVPALQVAPVPQYEDWGNFAASVDYQKENYPNANQTVAGAPEFGGGYNRFNRYAGVAAPGEAPAATPAGDTPSAPAAPAYEPRWDVDAYDNPIDPNWWQNNANTLQWVGGEEGYAPRPGVPEAAALKDYANIQAWEAENDKKWTSTYSPEWYSQQYIDDKTYGIAGGTNRKGTTQLQYGKKEPDWVRRLKPNPLKPRDTNKTYDQSILGEGTPAAAKMSYPAWAGDMATWRT